MPTENNYRPIDRRRFPRTDFRAAAKLLLAPATVTPCEILDIAEGGVGIAISTQLSSGTRCMISFDCQYNGQQRRVNAWGRIVYSNECGQVFRTGAQLLDMDSFSRLLLQEIH
jgi:hypothetical protein